MGPLVILVPTDQADIPIGSTAFEALARLGVTSVALATDDETTAIILEGWAFDTASPEAAVQALGADAEQTRSLQPIVQMALSAAAIQGGKHL